jgi:hypothetical protein
MCVRSLDRSHLVNGDLIDDLLAVCGVTESTDKLGLARTGIQNVSPGWRVLEAMRALSGGYHGLPSNHPLLGVVRRQGIPLGRCAIRAGEGRDWNTERGQYMTREQAQSCYEIYRRSVIKLNQHLPDKLPLPPDLDERGFCEREFMPDISRIPRQELAEFYDELWEMFRNAEPDP